MRLTKKIAIEKCKELWKWCMVTGKPKVDWPKWEENEKYAVSKCSGIMYACWLCEYAYQRAKASKTYEGRCSYCPYYKKYGYCYESGSRFEEWRTAYFRGSVTDMKKYAKLFYNQIKTLK